MAPFCGVWKTVQQVNGNRSAGECIKACIIGTIIRSQGGCVVRASSSGVIFHDGWGDWLGGGGLLVQEGLSQQEHEEEAHGYSSCALEGIQVRALSCTNNTADSALLPCFVVVWVFLTFCVSDDVCLKKDF